MVSYRDFDQLLNDEQVNEEARIRFTRSWLSNSYGIKEANQEWVEQLSSVHDHDDMPKHFGQVRIGSAFSALSTQLVRLPDGWHLATASKQGEQGVPIHPKQEGSYMHPQNQKLRMQLVQVVKNGKLLNPPAVTGTVNPLTMTNILPEDSSPRDEISQLNSAPVSPYTQDKTRSIDVDLSQYM